MFERVAASLRPGGRFAWNAFVFDPKLAASLDGPWQEQDGVRHRVDYVPADNRLTLTLEGGDSTTLWWVARSEWEALLDVSGLETEALYGWFDRRPFDDASREFVWVARKPTMSIYDPIAGIYDPWSRSVTEDVEFYVERGARVGRTRRGARRRDRAHRRPDRRGGYPGDRRRPLGEDARRRTRVRARAWRRAASSTFATAISRRRR